MISGIGASPGIAIAAAMRLSRRENAVYERVSQDTQQDLALFQSALRQVIGETQRLYEKTLQSMGEEQAAIFTAHRMILEDPELSAAVTAAIEQERYSVPYAIEKVMSDYVSLFEAMDDEYMRERTADMRDIKERLMRAVLGLGGCNNIGNLPGRRVIVAQDLSPSDTAAMDIKNVAGIITRSGGRTSHTAIMARSLEIPAVTAVGDAIERIHEGDLLIVDGVSGQIWINPDMETVSRYEKRQAELLYTAEQLKAYKDMETLTQDGRKLELAANIGTPEELSSALDMGAEGIGLFRSEFLFMDRTELPGEEEQYRAYRKVVEGMGGKRVIVRTLDVGGDKKLPALDLPAEDNPFLGYRAIRLCLDRKELFKTQLRALLRAGVYGNLHIMLPMISSVQEVRQAKAVIEEAKQELKAAGVGFADGVPVGIMIEIPAAVIIADALAREVDFFSIGTNDLVQYTTATDRGNGKVAHLYTPYHPAVLRLVSMASKAAQENGIFCGMCGEAAADERLTPVWIGMGLNELSVNPASVLRVRKKVISINYEDCMKIAENVISFPTNEEVEAYLSHQINA